MPYKDDSPIKNESKIIAQIESQRQMINFAIAVFNPLVQQRFWKQSVEHKNARLACTVTKEDTLLQLNLRQQLFFLACENLGSAIEEIVRYTRGSVPKDLGMLSVEIRLRPQLKYKKDGTSTGTRSLNIPHVDESKLLELRGFQLIHGDHIRLYSFADKLQIKVRAIDAKEGDRAINHLLKVVESKWLLGTSEQHSFSGEPPKDR
jgi:hypothetical protein